MKKMMKRAIPFLLTLVMVIGLLPTTAQAHHGKGNKDDKVADFFRQIGKHITDATDGRVDGESVKGNADHAADMIDKATDNEEIKNQVNEGRQFIHDLCDLLWSDQSSDSDTTEETTTEETATEETATEETATEETATEETTTEETTTEETTTEETTTEETTTEETATEETATEETAAEETTTEETTTEETTTENSAVYETIEIIDEEVPMSVGTILNTEDAIAYLFADENDNIRPEDSITRAEVAEIFYLLMTEDFRDSFYTDENDFTDVSADSEYNEAISTVVNAGILCGYEDDTFRPDEYITRAEFAVIAAGFLGEEYEDEDLFDDIAEHEARNSINGIAAAGWLVEYEDEFRPDDEITRAEVASIINMMLERDTDTERYGNEMLTFSDNMDTEVWFYGHMQAAANG